MKSELLIVWLIIILLNPINIFSEEDDKKALEDEMFGNDSFIEEEKDDFRDEKGGISEEEKESIEEDSLDIGGSISTEFDYNILNTSFSDYHLYNPNTAMIYLDKRLKNLIRGFVRGKLIFDPTSARELLLSLEELWLKFHIANTLFFTIGKQKIKWGASKFWNPTDTLNTLKQDPFANEDGREGVTLFKTHIPIGIANLYAIGLFNNAHNLDEIGYAGRIEIPISTFEFSLSTTGAKGRKTVFGFDFSGGIGDIDLYSEFAFSFGSDKTFFRGESVPESYKEDKRFFPRVSSGIRYELGYSDEDAVTFCLEYYYNSEGYSDKDLYRWVFDEYVYEPYNLSRHYGMLMISMPQPGEWNDITFTLFNLGNFTDLTFITRPGIIITAIQDLTIDLSFGFHYGKADGEFTLGNQLIDIALSFGMVI